MCYKFMDEKKFSNQGKKNRAAGSRFELKARNELENQGWVVSKWMNNIDLQLDRLTPAKRKYNPFLRALSIGTGFPDFICFKREDQLYEVIGVEVKANGWLDKTEKEKCKWLLGNKTFARILIAKKSKERGKIEYIDFGEKYMKENVVLNNKT